MSRVLNIIAMLIALLSVVAAILITVIAVAFSVESRFLVSMIIPAFVLIWAWARVLNNQRG